MSRLFRISLLLWLGLGACQSSQTPVNSAAAESVPPAQLPPAAATGSAGAPSVPSTASPTPSASAGAAPFGALSEEEFKKLHELRADTPRALHGVSFNLPGGSRAYLSLPAQKAAPLPAVVVIHEWWGLNEHIQHWADRLAADGYAALAVDLYGGQTARDPDTAMKLMKAVDDTKSKATLLEAYRFLKDDARVRAQSRGVIGWCFGGKWSLNLAIAAPDLQAAVVYYGHVTTDPKELAAVKAPVLGIFGKKDESIPASHVQSFDRALTQLKVEHQILWYDAPHAFANPSGPNYNGEAARDAWEHTRQFLAAHLKPQAGR